MAKRKPASVAPVAILPGMTAEQTAEALNVSASPPVADVVAPVASDSAPSVVADSAPVAPPVAPSDADGFVMTDPFDATQIGVLVMEARASFIRRPDSAPVAPSVVADSAPNVPTPDAPPAPPCVVVSPPVADSAKPDPLLTPKAHALCVAFIAFIGDALNVATERMATWGERIRDIVMAEMNATEGWDSKSFDSTMTNIATEFSRANPDALPLRAADAWKVAEFRRHATTLGIPDVDRISAKRITNYLFPAGFVMAKPEATSTVRDGWADWLKHVVPIVARGEMNDETLNASVDLQRAALNASDPKRYPVKPATGAKSRKDATGSGRKTPKAPPVKPAPKAPPVKPAPAPIAPPVAPTPPPPPSPRSPRASTSRMSRRSPMA
jgi:hypothetical protein